MWVSAKDGTAVLLTGTGNGYPLSNLPLVLIHMSISSFVSKRKIKTCSFTNCLVCKFSTLDAEAVSIYL